MTYFLIGASGFGKSCAGNNILGDGDVFQAGHGTNRATVATRYVDGQRVTVVDTPGLNQGTLQEIKHMFTAASRMPFIIVQVMRYFKGGLQEKDRQSLEMMKTEFKEFIPK